jgi:antitoxin component YwqK of YwqJK toxin-antitoxin module
MPTKNFFYLILIIAFFSSCSSTKLVQKSNPNNNDVVEKYSVLKNDNSIRSGKYEQYYKGKIITEGFYVNNQKNGNWKYHDYSGILFITGDFKEDKKNGIFSTFLNGKVVSKCEFINDNLLNINSFREDSLTAFTLNRNSNEAFDMHIYNRNGILKEKYQIKYGKVDGMYNLYFFNGKLHREILYDMGVYKQIVRTFDINGNKIDGGNLINKTGSVLTYHLQKNSENEEMNFEAKMEFSNGLINNDFKTFFRNGKIKTEGQFNNGVRIGLWKYYKENSDSIEIKDFDKSPEPKDDFKNDSNDIKSYFNNQEFTRMPQFQGGDGERFNFISSNLVYPNSAKFYGKEGKVFISIELDELGEMVSMTPIYYSDETLLHAAKNLIKLFPRWNPDINGGVPVKSRVTIPINFQLK